MKFIQRDSSGLMKFIQSRSSGLMKFIQRDSFELMKFIQPRSFEPRDWFFERGVWEKTSGQPQALSSVLELYWPGRTA